MPDDLRLDDALYARLRSIAHRLAVHSNDPVVQPTSLVHDAWLKLADRGITFESRAHLLTVAARTLRQVLVDAARARARLKRGGGMLRTTLSGVASPDAGPVDLLALEDALVALESLDPRLAEVVHLRVFLGFSVDETADALGTSRRTVLRDWRFAQAWFAERLAADATG